MVWSQLELEKPHIAYACVGVFSTIFSLLSLFVKERLYIGEATVASLAGLILGPHCLGWFEPTTWGNSDYLTLEICRIVLCIQIVAVAVELPKKYMQKHWLSVTIFLLPVMTCGWLIVGLFIWALIPHFNFSSALLVSACVTATDPVLAAAVVGKGKFAERVPGHLRNLLSAESGCNDGMAFPFIFLSLNLVLYPGNAGEVVKDWFCYTILWECVFGCLFGAALGYVLKKAVWFAEKKGLIDRESFLAIFVFLAFNSAGLGSILGVDDLLVSFAAGTAFGWDGEFAKKTEESHVSTVIDLLLNLSFFVYFGAIIPWPQFNNADLGLNCWRLIVLAIVIIFLRRIPAVVALKPFTPDVKTWREAFFCGHFGPIGVGAIFAAILARKDLEGHYTDEETPLKEVPDHDFPHIQLLATIWPIVCFIVITSILVHGSSVAVLTLGKRLNRMAITMSFTTTNTQDQGPSWMSRLQKLDKTSTSFSLHRVDTHVPPSNNDEEKDHLPKSNTVETSGIKVRPAGGAKRRKHKKKKRGSRIKKSLSRVTSNDDQQLKLSPTTERQRPAPEFLQLGKSPSRVDQVDDETESPTTTVTPGKSSDDTNVGQSKEESYGSSDSSSQSLEVSKDDQNNRLSISVPEPKPDSPVSSEEEAKEQTESIPTAAYKEGAQIIIEDQHGEILETVPMKTAESSHGSVKKHGTFDKGERSKPIDKSKSQKKPKLSRNSGTAQSIGSDNSEGMSIHSMDSLRRHMSEYSYSGASDDDDDDESESYNGPGIGRKLSRSFSSNSRRALHKKNDPNRHRVYAHQVDNLIVIENEEGEIIRRYKVNPHVNVNKQKSRSRSSTIVNKALSLVGIKNKEGNNPGDISGQSQQQNVPTININGDDLERNEGVLIKEHDNTHDNSPLRDPHIESRIENKLTSILTKGSMSKGTNSKSATPVDVPTNKSSSRHRPQEDTSEEEDSEVSEDSEEDSEDEGLQETEVERKRRLAALGKLSTKRDSDDEEE